MSPSRVISCIGLSCLLGSASALEPHPQLASEQAPLVRFQRAFEACFERIDSGVRRIVEMLPRASRGSAPRGSEATLYAGVRTVRVGSADAAPSPGCPRSLLTVC